MRTLGVVSLVLLHFTEISFAQQPGHGGHPPPARDTVPRMRPEHRQHPMTAMPMTGPLGIPMSREGGGTAWQPDSSPMYAFHRMTGRWQLMLHGNVFGQYIREEGDRGDEQFGSVNWLMGMARHRLAGGDLTFRTMLSAEPATVGECGYPDLVATGESCNGALLHDRQHPHDLFMELTAGYEREISDRLAFQIYGGPVGEPALGPAGYPHRLSAMANPIAPIGHHWLDATHITFGLVTAGLYGRRWKLEGSLFNGREPDEDRYDVDLDALDSYSARLWILPGPRWALQGSVGRLIEVEPGRDGEPPGDQTRITASATFHAPGPRSLWATTAMWGQNRETDHVTNAVLIESSFEVTERDGAFARLEWTQKTGADLVLEEAGLAAEIFEVARAAGGYVRRMALGEVSLGVGGRVGVSLVPESLRSFYGSRTPVGFAVFVNLRPQRMVAHLGRGM
ncbi:MAG: hypothetical protein ACT4PM_03730 [Gemmatimonadales bacterium]